MATVRFSKDLIDDIKRNAALPFDNKLKELERSVSFDGWAETVWEALCGEHLATIKAVPHNWFRTTSRLMVKIPDTSGHHGSALYFILSDPRPMPNNFEGNADISEVGYSGIITLNHRSSKWDDLRSVYTAWMQQKASVTEQRRAMSVGIEELTKTYATLGPALKAWPALWDLLPDYAKNKHKEIVKREKAVPATLKADLGSMTAAMTVVKMMGGL